MSNDSAINTVSMSEDDFDMIKKALRAADKMATSVISGEPGAHRVALDFARVINDLKRCPVAKRL